MAVTAPTIAQAVQIRIVMSELVTEIDNRMEWYMKHRGIKGVTLSWGGEPTILLEDDMIYPKSYEQIRFKEFYKNSDWPKCPITNKKLPIGH